MSETSPEGDERIAQGNAVGRMLAALPRVRAVAMGGSLATGVADAASDVDLYVFADAEPPEEARRALIEPRAVPGTLHIGNPWFGPGDEWRDVSGIAMDAMYWTCAWMTDEVAARLDRHEPAMGYSTAFLHTLARARPVSDDGWLASLRERVQGPYPEGLAEAIIGHNLPLLDDHANDMLHQIEGAARRGDAVAMNHRTASFLASAFDVLFAHLRSYHPGEKRLIAHARAAGANEDLLSAMEGVAEGTHEERVRAAREVARRLRELAGR